MLGSKFKHSEIFNVKQTKHKQFRPPKNRIFPIKKYENITHRNLKLNLYNINWNRSTGIVEYCKMYNLISIKAFLSASMQRSNKLLCLFIALFINSTYSAIYKQDISQLYSAAACVCRRALKIIFWCKYCNLWAYHHLMMPSIYSTCLTLLLKPIKDDQLMM